MAKSQAQTSYESVLDTPSSQIERPKPLPVGQYTCVVQGQPRFDKSSKKQTEFVEFTLKVLQAEDTVDTDALEEFLTKLDGSKRNLTDVTVKDTYYQTEGALWRLKDFLDHCNAGDEDMTLRQRVSQTPGCQVMITIRHEASTDGTSVYAKIGSTAPVE